MAGPRHFRAWPRLRTESAVVLRRSGAELRVRLVDLGLGGAGVVSPEPLQPGASIELVLHAPNRWDPLVVPARVAWVGRAGRAGLAFVHGDDADAFALFEMLGAQGFE